MEHLKKLTKWLRKNSFNSEANRANSLYKAAISKGSVKELQKWLGDDYSKLSFDDLFEGKLRLLAPFETKEEERLYKIVSLLKEDGWAPASGGGFFDTKFVEQKMRRLGGEEYTEEVEVADFKIAKESTKVIPAGPRAGEEIVSKKVMSLPRVLKRKASGETFRWWQENQSEYSRNYNWKQVEAAFRGEPNPNGSSLIISRDPLDVLRMSDHENLRSCHSEGASYFECAVAESRGNGLVAYLVDNDDVKKLLSSKVSESEDAPAEELDLSYFDKKEIFSDNNRGVAGIKPRSRVRLRKYVDESNDYEFAAPEHSTYGPHPPGFVGAVRAWAWKSQGHLFENEWNLPDFDDLEMHGGSYRDTSDGEVLNAFFASGGFAESYSGNVETISENEIDTFAMWEAEISETLERAHAELQNVSFHAEVNGEHDPDAAPYVSASVYLSIVIPYNRPENSENELPEGDSYKWEYSTRREIESLFEHPEYGHINSITIDPDKIGMDMSFDCEDCNNPDGVAAYYTYIRKEIDGMYDEYVEKVRRGLMAEGYIAEIEFDRAEKRLEASNLKHFNVIGGEDDGQILISLNPESKIEVSIPGVLFKADNAKEQIMQALPAESVPGAYTKYILGDEYKLALITFLNEVRRDSVKQLSFDFAKDWRDDSPDISLDQIVNNLKITSTFYPAPEGAPDASLSIYMSISIRASEDSNHVVFVERFVRNIDDNFEDIRSRLFNIATKNLERQATKKAAELKSFYEGSTAMPVIDELLKHNQPDVIRLALWVKSNWSTFTDAEKEVAYYSFLLPVQRDGDYVHKDELSYPRFWEGIMQKRHDTSFNYRWDGISMKDVMPYTDLNSDAGKDPNFGRGGAWVDENGRVSPPTVAQLESLFIKN